MGDLASEVPVEILLGWVRWELGGVGSPTKGEQLAPETRARGLRPYLHAGVPQVAGVECPFLVGSDHDQDPAHRGDHLLDPTGIPGVVPTGDDHYSALVRDGVDDRVALDQPGDDGLVPHARRGDGLGIEVQPVDPHAIVRVVADSSSPSICAIQASSASVAPYRPSRWASRSGLTHRYQPHEQATQHIEP